jgi:pimeloyl-ACP methyl ester carboxylesterase
VRIIKKLLFGLLGCLFILALALPAPAAEYQYPIKDPIAATILGTPEKYRAELPQKIRVKEYETITIFPERKVPEVFWYNRKLRYAVAWHRKEAPLMVLIAGTGAGYDSTKMKSLQKAFYQAGYHVLSLSSPTHPNFIVAASQSSMPGESRADAVDLYRVMEKIFEKSSKKELVTGFYLCGYSLGAAEAAYVALLDEEKKVFNFQKVLMLNPPVNIYESAVRIDRMMLDNIPGGIDHFNEFFSKLIHSISTTYSNGDFVDLSYDFFYHAYSKIIPNPREGKALIGFSFRISLANLIFTADVMNNRGYIVPKNLKLFKTDSLTDYFKVAAHCQGFEEYAKKLLYPYYREHGCKLSFEEFVAHSSLKDIEDYLKNSPKIGLMTNADDFILGPGDLDYLRRVFGDRARIYPHGGHCGNLDYKDNVRDMIDFFQQQ